MAKQFTLVLALAFLCVTNAFGIQHWKGNQKALVLLLQWADQAPGHTAKEMATTFFDDKSMSLRSFFLENSNGKFTLDGEVKDWRKTHIKWDPEKGCTLKPIVTEAWTQFASGLSVKDYDADGNGKVDNLFIVHSGRIDKDRVGPECTFISFDKADHAIVFQEAGLGSIGERIPIGFYIHEAGHGYFNFPDLYADHFHGKYGIGMWGMMGLGAWGTYNKLPRAEMFRYPSHFEPLSKVKIGWVTPTVVNASVDKVVLRPTENSGDVVAIPAGFGANYYLEYRSKRGFSTGHLGHGLVIWKNYELIQADGRDDLNHGHDLGVRPLPPIDENFGDGTDPFPGGDGVKTFADPSHKFEIRNIEQFDDRVEFSVAFKAGEPRMPYTEPLVDGWDGVERL